MSNLARGIRNVWAHDLASKRHNELLFGGMCVAVVVVVVEEEEVMRMVAVVA